MHVEWGDCRLKKGEVVISLKNSGKTAWNGYSVVVEVLHEHEEITKVRQTSLDCLEPETYARVAVKLDKPIDPTRFYSVKAIVFASRNNVVSQVWRLRAPESTPTFPKPGERIGMIPEPNKLRKSIDPINVKKCMGLL